MKCPKYKSKVVFKATVKSPIRKGFSGKIIGYEPQYGCLSCGLKWDLVEKGT